MSKRTPFSTVDHPMTGRPYPVPESPGKAARDENGRFMQLGAETLPERVAENSSIDLLRWMATRRKAKWPKYRPLPHGTDKPPERVEGDKLRISWVGHSSCLVQMAGLNLLTDPIWSTRCSPIRFLGPRRATPPGINPVDLPPIDAILLSHGHYDHLDIPTLKWICESHAPTIYCGLEQAALLKQHHVSARKIVEMDWQDSVEYGDARIHFLPARHWTSRGKPGDRNLTLWGAFAVEHKLAGKLYFAGDTGFGPHFDWAREQFGGFRCALIPIGAYEPRWFMHPQHIDAREAAEAFRRLNTEFALGIHHSAFQLTDEGIDAPRDMLDQARRRLGIPPDRFRTIDIGAHWDIPAVHGGLK